MAEFLPAYYATRKIEAGWTSQPHETYAGIDRKFWPQWDGWVIIDKVKKEIDGVKCSTHWIHKLNDILDKNEQLQKKIQDFYRTNFWTPNYGNIISQKVCNYIYDKAVNMGAGQIHKLVQRTLKIKDDGVFGKVTQYQVNSRDPEQFLIDLDKTVDQFYEHLARSNPAKYAKYLKGWKKR